ncbi:MAG: hypothetical protein EOP40_05510, partial [Rubrivivax sp.]
MSLDLDATQGLRAPCGLPSAFLLKGALLAALALGAVPWARAQTPAAAPPSGSAAHPPTPRQPAWQGVWRGQLGAQDVVVALYRDDDTPHSGRYFYERFGRDLSLWRAPPDASSPTAEIRLFECPPDYGADFKPCEQPTGVWTLSPVAPSGSNATGLQGQWQSAGLQGRRPPPPQLVKLSRVADYAPAAEAFHDPYEQLRQRGIRETRRAGGQRGTVAWRTLVDERSRIAVPQLTSGASHEVLSRINRQLKTQWMERIGHALSAVDFDDELTVAFANPRWLATTYSVGFYFAGAAHPSSGFRPATYDLRTGEVVDLARWFRFSAPGAAPLQLERRDLLAALALKAITGDVAARAGGADEPECFQQVLEHHHCSGGQCTDGQLSQGHVPTHWLLWPTDQGL